MPLLLVLSLLSAADKPRLVVLELQAGAGVEASLTTPLTEALTAEAQRGGFFEVVSTRDLQSLLGLERQRQLLGCGDEAKSCMAELTDALGARFVMTGTLARLGEAWQLTLSTLDSQKAQPLGRATRLARSLEALRATLPWAVAEATGTPAPAPPSRALPITLLAGGGAAALFGLVWGGLHLSQAQQLSAVLDAAGDRAGLLNTRAFYAAQLRTLETQEWLAAGALGVGVAAMVAGLFLLPPDPAGTQVALVPRLDGVAFAGVFP